MIREVSFIRGRIHFYIQFTPRLLQATTVTKKAEVQEENQK